MVTSFKPHFIVSILAWLVSGFAFAVIDEQLAVPPDAEPAAACTTQNCLQWEQDAEWEETSELAGGEAFSYFRVINPSGKEYGGQRLVSRRIDIDQSGQFPALCATIQYRFRGSHEADVEAKFSLTYQTVDKRGNPTGESPETPIWNATYSRNSNDTWRTATFQLSEPPSSIRLVLKASMANLAEGQNFEFGLAKLDAYASMCFKRDGDTFIPFKPVQGIGAGTFIAALWPNAQVFYEFAPGFSADQRKAVLAAFTEVSSRIPCIRFMRRDGQSSFVRFDRSPTGCEADVGFLGQQQSAIMNEDCFANGMPSHLALHILGMRHEHIRPDRDSFVTVFTQNVDPTLMSQIRTRPLFFDPKTLTFPYDVQSVLHAGNFDFAKAPGLKTMQSRANPNVPLGNKIGPTELDFRKLASLYGCPYEPPVAPSTPNPRAGSSAAPSEQPCRQILAVARGRNFISNYRRPANGLYRANEFCGWLVKVPAGKAIKFTVTSLDIEWSANCSNDGLEFFEGSEALLSNRIGDRLCGSSLPLNPAVTINSNIAMVVFRSDSFNEGSGFRVDFEEVFPPPPPPPPLSVDPTLCNFDNSLCRWTVFPEQSWRLGIFSSLRAQSPSSYIYLGAGTRSLINQKSVIFSPHITPMLQRYPNVCIKFAFTQDDLNGGRQVGTLKLFAESDYDQLLLWANFEDPDLSDRSFGQWQRVSVDLSAEELLPQQPYRLSFIGNITKFTRGGIAIDDVGISTDFCDDENEPIATTTVTTTSTTTARQTTTTLPAGTALEPLPLYCDFELATLCDETFNLKPPSNEIAAFLWQNVRARVGAVKSTSAPREDRSLGTMMGRYLWANSYNRQPLDQAIIDTKPIDGSEASCLSFSYYMNGDAEAQLEVKLILTTSVRNIVTFRGNRGSAWRDAVAKINVAAGRKFQLRFIATVATSDIAVDDIRLFKGAKCTL